MTLNGASARIRLAAVLWLVGVREALQLQRCIVFFVLDGSGTVLAQVTRCFVTNGLIYLGSIALHRYATQRAVSWLLARFAEPAYGPVAVAAWSRLLGLLFQLLWLLPLYAITLMVSCIWYQQVAVAAFEVQQQQRLQQQQQQAGGGPGPASSQASSPLLRQPQVLQLQLLLGQPAAPGSGAGDAAAQQLAAAGGAGGAASSSSSSGGMMVVLEGAAQELFRVLLFLVFTVEVYVASLLPLIGGPLNVLLLSWLYAYYCYDYSWALQGCRLPLRLQFFEQHWAFFAGFGFPCVVATAFLPFHVGGAAANLLFPAFILVACASDPAAAQGAVVAPGSPSLGSIPIFKLALRPTAWLIRRALGGRRGAGAGDRAR